MHNLLLDNDFTNFVLKKTDLFKRIHPNWITFLGLVCNAILYITITNKLLVATAIILFVRYSCDLLDGGIARKYNKVSKGGGIFDSISDNLLIFTIAYSIGNILLLDNALYISIILAVGNIFYMISENAFINHDPIKQGKGIIKGTYSFFVNNNCISYTGVYIIICYISMIQ
jgi:phosphatidylserine synthase